MGCTPAPACKAMRAEATRRWPMRNQASDGICSSLDHRKQNPGSDHDYGNAVDLTHDPGAGVDCHVLAEVVKHDPRTKYVIWNRRISNPSIQAGAWRSYTGSNPHTKHMHVSIRADARDDVSRWFARHQEDDMTDEERKELFEIGRLARQMNHQIIVPGVGLQAVLAAVKGEQATSDPAELATLIADALDDQLAQAVAAELHRRLAA